MIRRLRKTTTLCALLLSGMGMLCLWKEAPPTDLSGASLAKSIFLKQAAFLAVGTAALGLSVLPNYQHYRRWAWGPYLVLLGALAGLLLAGRFTRGARGWYALGPVHLQPAEFMKVALVLVLARLLMHGRNLDRWRGLVPPILATALPAALILLQPDLGTAILFIPTLLAMLYAAGSRKRHLAAIVLALAAAAPVGYLFFLKEYQRLRLASFRPDISSHPVQVEARLGRRNHASILLESPGWHEVFIPAPPRWSRTKPPLLRLRVRSGHFVPSEQGWGEDRRLLGVACLTECLSLAAE